MFEFLRATLSEPMSFRDLMRKIEVSDSLAHSKISWARVNDHRDIKSLNGDAENIIFRTWDVVVFYPKEGMKFPTDIAFGV
ncbi:MAG: hypothetical protein WCO05_03835 [Candidatus Moraniibacteriota bacterium]